MRIKLLAAAAATVLLVATAGVTISCQDGTTTPTSGLEFATDQEEFLGIYGYTYDEEQGEIVDAWVVWDCETCDSQVGHDVTNVFGEYEIYLTALGWQTHEGHNLGGTATHPSYNPAYNSIPDFSYIDIPYGPIDFILTSM